MNNSKIIKDYRWSTIALICIIILIVIFAEILIPKTKLSYKTEVEQIASARIYYGIKSCPNEPELNQIRSTYISTIDQSDIKKRVWVLKNFNSVYTETCIKDS